MPLATDINVHRHKHRYRANGTPVQGISDTFPRRLVCKDFAITLIIGKMDVSRFVFSDRQCIRTETGDSAGTENTNCQEIQAE
ncbi:hypothetical protein [uncultured Bacteroides sp.]|uniref:hypothetical protein n=1 Tax=uncultured Bacteroides sp. TaxID=162156 RepID=UPI0025D0BBD0|nr:hypothetical protein [uncultured Bacteroides sp.]